MQASFQVFLPLYSKCFFFTRLPQQSKMCQFPVIISFCPSFFFLLCTSCEVFMVQTLVGRLSQLLITDPVFGELCDTQCQSVLCLWPSQRSSAEKQLAFPDSTLLIILPREAFMCRVFTIRSERRSISWWRR